MKETGIVRQIDELGRIVLPKEIRKSLRIREGDHLEIFTHEDSIIIKKYSPVESINDFSEKLANAIFSSTKKSVILTDKEKIIAVAGFNANLVGKNITLELEERISANTVQVVSNGEVEIAENLAVNKAFVLKPITEYGNVLGAVIIFNDKISDVEKNIAEYTATILTKYIE
jgi:AbrB family transcriptional regulator (stage V sporulation protein T)